MSQQFSSPFVIRQLVEYVQGRIGRTLKQDELSYVRNFMKEHVPQQMHLTPIQLAQSIRGVGNHLARLVATHSQQQEVVDVHEMLQDLLETENDPDTLYDDVEGLVAEKPAPQSVDVFRILGMRNPYTFSMWINPYSVYGTRHLLLDSSQRDNRGQMDVFRWDVIPTAVQDITSVTFAGPLRHIVAARISPFWTPGPSEVSLPPAQTSIFEFYVGIDEFAEQAYLDLGNTKSQFILQAPPAVYVGDELISLSPLQNNRGLFVFNKPVTRLDSITLRILSNGLPVPLAPEYLVGTVTIFAGVVSIQIPSIFTVLPIATNPYPLQVGQAVAVQAYPMPVGMDPQLYQAITDPNGVEITFVIGAGDYELGNVNAAGSPNFGPDNSDFLIPRRVLHIALSLIYRHPEQTNDLE